MSVDARMATIAAATVIPLDGSCSDVEILGGKGAALDRLVGLGFRVPPVTVITTRAYRRFAAEPAVSALIDRIRGSPDPVLEDIVDKVFLAADVPADLSHAIRAAARSLSSAGAIAVRSSASAEDRPDLSFAGQFRSTLNVLGDDEVLRAVRLTWASLWHPAPVAYRRAWQVPDSDAAMAVVLMRMVPADTAGVVFTEDPTNRHLLRVEAVAGLADSLVSGAETPQVWQVDRSDPRPPVDAPEFLAELAAVTLSIERALGHPQDVEWAFDGTAPWIVQSRPITTRVVDDDAPAEGLRLTTAGIAEMLPGVLPPRLWEVNAFVVEEALRAVLDSAGGLPAAAADRRFLHRVRGRVALALDLIELAADSQRAGSAAEMERQYFGDVARDQSVPRRRWQGLRGIASDVRVAGARRVTMSEAVVVVVATDLIGAGAPTFATMPDSALFGYRTRLLDVAARAMAAELGVAAAAAASYERLEATVARHLGAEEAASVVQRITVGAGLPPPPSGRSCMAVFGGATWEETGGAPAPHEGRSTRVDGSSMSDLEYQLRALPGWTRTRILTGQIIDVRIHLLRQLVADVIRGLRLREQVKAAVLAIGGEVRRVDLELAGRLVGAGALRRVEDVDLITTTELRAASAGGALPVRLLADRRRQLARWAAYGPLPEQFSGLPEPMAAPTVAGDRISGWAASPGRFTGIARSIDNPLSRKLLPGEVLVAAATDASWTPLFLDASAIVVERGGPLSHAAVVARELGIPAVVNVPNAAVLLDGHRVTVDGDAGIVVFQREG